MLTLTKWTLWSYTLKAVTQMLCGGISTQGESERIDNSLCPSLLSYSGRVVGNGLQAQRQNPEMKVRSPDSILVEVKEKLVRFNQVGWVPSYSCAASVSVATLSGAI